MLYVSYDDNNDTIIQQLIDYNYVLINEKNKFHAVKSRN